MPVTPTHPGVYVTALPSGNRTITGVATSVTAFVGRMWRGPVDDPVPVSSWPQFERQFGGLWRGSGLSYAVRDFFTGGGSQAVVVRVVREAATAALDVDGLPLQAFGPGTWANGLQVAVEHPSGPDAEDVADGQGVSASDLFTLTVRESDADDAATEVFRNVTVVDGPRRVDLVLAASQLVRVVGDVPAGRPSEGDYDVPEASRGSDGGTPRLEDYDGPGFAAGRRGIHALARSEGFNLLCLPPPTPGGDLPEALWPVAAQLCVDHQAFLLVDPPGATTASGLPAWVAGAGLSGPAMRHAALYFPRVRRPDPLRGGTTADFAPCGTVAGTIARTDATRGVWKAPAGTDAGLAGVTGLVQPLTDVESGDLNPRGINCLRTFPGVGTVVWGARTLRGADVLADDYRYVPVMRLYLYLHKSLHRGTQWVVFEPNDAPLWSQIRTSLGAFMHDLFRRGAFQGATPRDAYFVRCDEETNTQYDIDRGIVNILVGFAPLNPAEFVVIGIQHKTLAASE